MNGTYLDYNATAPIRPVALAASVEAMRAGGNPSSVHAAGRAARAMMEAAREQVAALIAAPASTVIFTSGGTEANALAVESATAAGSRRLLISATEHDCVRATAEAGAAIAETWPVNADGAADLDWLEARLQAWSPADGRPFAALMAANNETGVIQPVAAAAALLRAVDGWLHVDAVQAAGKIALDSRALESGGLGADTLAIASHKIGGPTGVGALTFGPRAVMTRRIHGGGQERGRRAGTENIAGIAGFGAAAQAAARDLDALADQAAWRDAVAARLIDQAGVTVFGADASRLPNTLCFAAPGFSSELQLMALDLEGVMVSAGSACSSGKVKASHVLLAMGAGALAGCALRVSGGWNSGQADWNRFADAWLAAHARQQSRRQPSAA
jgi:cysteine desulfurase